MRRRWYVHRFLNGVFHSTASFTDFFDAVDKLVAKMEKIHGPRGWSYVITDNSVVPLTEPRGVA